MSSVPHVNNWTVVKSFKIHPLIHPDVYVLVNLLWDCSNISHLGHNSACPLKRQFIFITKQVKIGDIDLYVDIGGHDWSWGL